MNYLDASIRGIGILSALRTTSNFVAGSRPGKTWSDMGLCLLCWPWAQHACKRPPWSRSCFHRDFSMDGSFRGIPEGHFQTPLDKWWNLGTGDLSSLVSSHGAKESWLSEIFSHRRAHIQISATRLEGRSLWEPASPTFWIYLGIFSRRCTTMDTYDAFRSIYHAEE